LLTKDLRSQRTTSKLDLVKVGPFLVIEVRRLVNYKLQLPDNAKVHPVFHISILEPADPETLLQTTSCFQTEEEDGLEVERRLERGQQYVVKWKGYPHSENTWEPKQNLRNCQRLLQQFQHIFGESYATFSAGVFGHSGKDSLLTKVETRRQQLIMYVSVGTTLVRKGDGVTILPMTGSRRLLCCSPHLGTTEHLA
jgi:hypothetical protein